LILRIEVEYSKSFPPETNNAQIEDKETLVALHSQGLFKIDPRLSGEKQVSSTSFCYSANSNTQLSCGATTG